MHNDEKTTKSIHDTVKALMEVSPYYTFKAVRDFCKKPSGEEKEVNKLKSTSSYYWLINAAVSLNINTGMEEDIAMAIYDDPEFSIERFNAQARYTGYVLMACEKNQLTEAAND